MISFTRALARELGLRVRRDLRGTFRTYADGMRWLWQTHRKRFNHHLCAVVHPDVAWVLGYDIQWRGLIFWVSGEKDGGLPGADPMAERQVMAEIFSQLPPNGGMRGFPWHGHGVGMGEGGGVRFCGGYGRVLVATNLTPNVSVLSGVRVERLTPPRPAPCPPLQRDKVYVALNMSDGDNLNTFYHYFTKYFEHPAHGTFPIGWGMSPAILDEFVADVAGIGYVFPQTYASRYRERGKVVDGFMAWTARYMDRLGMRTVRPHGGDRDTMARYARGIPSMHSVFADYARRGLPYDESVYTGGGGMPVFHALTHWHYGKDGLLRDIREQVGAHRPAFVNDYLHNWTIDMASLQRACEGRDPDMVFVTPAHLAALYRQARRPAR